MSMPRQQLVVCVLLGVSLALLALGASIGSAGLDASAWQWLLGHVGHVGDVATNRDAPTIDTTLQQIIVDIRLPRTVGAWAAGALLGLAGAVAQGLFRNPLADPFLLGSAPGASLAVALALATTAGGAGVFASDIWTRLGLTGAAFAGAVLAVLLTLVLSRGVQHTLRLLLAGVVVGVVLGALTQLVLLMSPQSLLAMQAFLLGSTGFVGWDASILMWLVWLICAVVGTSLARALDALSLGEHTAASLGLPLAPMRMALVAVLALATGTAVAQTGLVAFVGLAAPHVVRGLVKVKHGALLWLSSLMGGVLLLAADVTARWLIAPQELPVGVLTAVLGGGYLLWLMHRAADGFGVAGKGAP